MSLMGDLPITRPSLLIRIRDPMDADAWAQFVDLYGPVVYQFSRKRGLQDADAADLTQTVFHAVAHDIRRFNYDPGRGLFRGWLFRVVRNQFHKLYSRQRLAVHGSGDTTANELLAEHPARSDEEEEVWQQEYELHLFRWAAERVRACFEESSWHAFWLTAVDGKCAKDVAGELGLTVGAVYTAKSRVLVRIKREIDELQREEELPPRNA
jgi:RNA polymerase sigma-70 factor (ECF subfamily)